MSKANTWLPLYVGDYLRKTMRLTTEQHGAYLLLLMACWAEGGSITADEEDLAATVRLPLDRWLVMAPRILPFFEERDGRLHNARLSEELARANNITEARREAGRSSAARRQQNSSKPAANEKQNAIPSQSQSHKEDADVAHAHDNWPEGDSFDHAKLLLSLAGSKLSGMSEASKIASGVHEIGRWRQAGCAWGLDVVPTIVSMATKKRGGKIQSWGYFTEAVAQSKADRERPLTIPEGRTDDQPASPNLDRRHANLGRALAGADRALARRRQE